MRILYDGALHPDIESDYRINDSQQVAMLKIAATDPQAEVVATDAKQRPVVRAKLGGSVEATNIALYPSGKPAPVTEPIKDRWVVEATG